MLTLYRDAFWISPYVFSCWIALTEKELAFDAREVSLGDAAQKRDEYAKPSVTARVPALRHDDFWIAESSAIVEYLDDAFPDSPPMLPRDRKHRARARHLMSWIRSDDTLPIRSQRSTHTMFYAPTSAPLDDEGARAAAKLFGVAERVIPGDGGDLFGAYSIADAELAFMLHRLMKNRDAVPVAVAAWAARQWQRPSVAGFVALERKPYVPY